MQVPAQMSKAKGWMGEQAWTIPFWTHTRQISHRIKDTFWNAVRGMRFADVFSLTLWVCLQGETVSGCCTLANMLNQKKGYPSSDAAQISPAPQILHYAALERPPGQIHIIYQNKRM